MDNLNYGLIIPMAGFGSRFKKAGYATYKPFIKIKDKFMIDYVLDSFQDVKNKYIIINPNLLTLEQKSYLQDIRKVTLIEIEPHILGPAYSIFQARKSLPTNLSYFISYCDIYWTWDFEEMKKNINGKDGTIFTRQQFHPHLVKNNFSAFCRIDESGKVLEIKEKSSFTKDWMNEPLSIGAFFVKDALKLIESIEKLIQNKEMVGIEYFPSLIFNYLISSDFNINSYDIDFFIHWGTPEQLEDFQRWDEIFKNHFIRENSTAKNKINSIMIMGGKGERLLNVSNQIKPLIPIFERPMYKYILQAFKSKFYEVITTNQISKKLDEKKENLINIGELTSSPYETISKGLEKSKINNNFLLLSCDAYCDFDHNLFQNFIDQNRPDVVILTFTPSLLQTKYLEHYTHVSITSNIITDIHIKSKSNPNDKGLAGLFWFKDSKILSQKIENIPQGKEISIDHILKSSLGGSNKIMSYEINNYVHLGTELEFKEFTFWNRYRKIIRTDQPID